MKQQTTVRWVMLVVGTVLTAALTGLACKADPKSSDSSAEARHILEIAGIRGGLVVHLGCGNGQWTTAFRAGDGYAVQGLDVDWANVSKAREHVAAQELRGPVSIELWTDPSRLPYADNLVNLIVAEKLGQVPMSEAMRVMAPNGVICIKRDGRWTTIAKPRPKDIDEWSHWLHDASGDTVSHDRLVGPPRHLQWCSGPTWGKHHEGAGHAQLAMVSASGRFFSIEDDTPPSFFGLSARWQLIARDAFNGVVLWRRPLSDFFMTTWNLKGWGWGTGGPVKRLLVAADDRVFLPLATHAPISALDAATGKVVATYPQTEDLTELLCDRGVLVGGGPKKTIAVDSASAKTLWQREDGRDVVAKDGLAFLVNRGQIIGMELATGREIWKTSPPRPGNSVPKMKGVRDEGVLRVGTGVVLYCGGLGVAALAMEDGRILWSKSGQYSRGNNAFLIGDLVWLRGRPENGNAAMTIALDARTGALKQQFADNRVWNAGHHVRCYPPRATERFLLYNMRGAELLDLTSGDIWLNNWIRATCGQGMMPCNGLLYAGPHSCRCYSENSLHGLYALAADSPESNPPRGVSDSARLQRGPAFTSAANLQPSIPDPQDWPTYRGDAARSGSARSKVPTSLAPLWRTVLRNRLSSPVQADGQLYVAGVDAHAVTAFDAQTGRVRWQFTTGGRVDSPPTIHRGLVLFGSADGSVYALRAADGQMVWRFHAAPADRFVGTDGQVESAWPVHGSILVRNELAYFAAGRSSFLDGGIYVYALDPLTGRIVHQARLEGPWPTPDVGTDKAEHLNPGYSMSGARSDPMVADDRRIYLGHMAFDPQLRKVDEPLAPNGHSVGKWWDDAIKYASPDNDPQKIPIELDPLSYYAIDFGPRLYSTSGLFDAAWHNRQYWSYGRVSGNYLVFNGRWGYTVKAYRNATRWTNHQAGDGYVLSAGEAIPARRLPPTDLRPWRMREGDHPEFEKGKEVTLALNEHEYQWSIRLALRPVAMVLAGDTLWVAGQPDPADPSEALAALEGKRGGQLVAISAADGTKVANYPLESPPVFDGMAIAAGRLYLTGMDGSVTCFGGK